ncbi:YdeI/OmpD-associated family protein [Actinomycetes bacterium KLBMP 9759]
MNVQRFTAVLVTGPRKGVFVPAPFDPDAVWGTKAVHHITGTVDGMPVRGRMEPLDSGSGVVLGPAWRRACGLAVGDSVDVELAPEGPQRADLAPDIVAAFHANPTAGAYFDALATFYRTKYLKWIDATTRRPAVRAQRIAEVVALCEAGEKEQP